MNTKMRKQISKQIDILNKKREEIEKSIPGLPKGSIIVNGKNKFIYKDLNGIKTHIGSKKINFIKAVAQRQYLEDSLNDINETIEVLSDFEDRFYNLKIFNRYKNLSQYRRKLITNIFPSYENLSQNFLLETSSSNIPIKQNRSILTNNGDLVRSKSEKIIADALLQYGVAYKYEHQIQAKNGKQLYPDFTILSPVTNNIIYWEHFGLMDMTDYSKNVVNKINIYQELGIVLGHNLIATFEYKDNPLKTQNVIGLIQKVILDD